MTASHDEKLAAQQFAEKMRAAEHAEPAPMTSAKKPPKPRPAPKGSKGQYKFIFTDKMQLKPSEVYALTRAASIDVIPEASKQQMR